MTTGDDTWLAEQFETNRGRLRALSYRMLGAPNEADDAVQESWLRLRRSDAGSIANLGGWLTTVVARVCLDMLRSRTARREESLDARLPDAGPAGPGDPEQDALLADSVGLAMLVVLDRLPPAERVAFVLHDMFGVAFEEIAAMLRRSPDAARQLASRARRRVRGASAAAAPATSGQRQVIAAFLAAMRAGDVEALVAVLDPDVLVRVDGDAAGTGAPREVRGARSWAQGAIAFARYVRFMEPALVDGNPGFIVAPRGRLLRAARLTIADGRITYVEIIAAPARLRRLRVALLGE